MVELQVYKEAFAKFDDDNSGSLEPAELFELIEALEGECDKNKVRLTIDKVDNDGSASLDMDEFLAFMSVYKHVKSNEYATAVELVRKTKSDSYAKGWKNVLLVMFMVIPPSAGTVLDFILCDNVEGIWFLRADTRRQCYDGTWWWYFPAFVVGFVIYVVVFPMFFWLMLAKNKEFIKHNPNDSSSITFKKFGFLYMAYTPDCWWWDVFETYRRLFLGLSAQYVGEGTWLQIVYALWLTECAVLLHCQCNPFKAKDDNTLQFMGYMGYFAVLFYGLMLRSVESRRFMQDPKVVLSVTIALWLVVGCFVYQCFLMALKLRKLLPKLLKTFKASTKAALTSSHEDKKVRDIQRRSSKMSRRSSQGKVSPSSTKLKSTAKVVGKLAFNHHHQQQTQL